MGKETTITGGLKIPDSFCDIAENIIAKNLNEKNSVSDIILASAKSVREEALGECDIELSEYEKKLFFSGFVLGIRKIENDMNNAKKQIVGDLFGKILKDFGIDTEDKE